MSTKKKVLGRGLSNFVKDSEKAKELLNTDGSDLITLKIDEVIPNPNQPRKVFEEKALEELTESIKEFGILQPIIVRKTDEKHEIVAGERRYRAAKEAGLTEVPVIIKNISEADAEKISLIENIQREDLNPIEEALGYKNIMENYSLTQEALSEAIGKSRSYISNSIRLLNLDERVIKMLQDGLLTSSHGRLLLKIKSPDEQFKKALKIVEEGSSVKETVVIVQRRKKKTTRDEYLSHIEDKLMEALGTKVLLKGTGKRKKVEIEYYNDDDLSRILEVILGGGEID